MSDELTSQSDTSSEDSEPMNNEIIPVLSTNGSPRSAGCVKLSLDDHIRAFLKKENLDRQFECLNCSSELMDKVVSNYLIVKQIMSNMHWRDKLLCKQVCTTWHSAVQALRREQLAPMDFSMDSLLSSSIWATSSDLVNEPLVVMTFVNGAGLSMIRLCQSIYPPPCSVPCFDVHNLLDAIQKYTCAPKECVNIIRSDYISYMPVPTSVTYKLIIDHLSTKPYLVGLSIPVIPDVKFHTINIRSKTNIQQDFYEVVQNISEDRIFKGIFVYVTDRYLLHSGQDIFFLNRFKEVQPDIPYALGGCIIEDTLFKHSDLEGVVKRVDKHRDFISGNLVSISMFTIPKNPQSNECNFNMYSVVLESSVWSKVKIQQTINDFSKRVPQFEYSVVVKLSCVGRDKKHKWEQDCFRAVFPNTRLVGCYGNGELGVDHPPKPDASPYPQVKKPCPAPNPRHGLVYSYSTVFVYMGWGKILSNGPP
ncbi:uncharacterized protein LOC112043131 [Bicyclus anynana]|uniref:Uncharacterized protein LOC112043131 n=1 Tax=Bicyclus anynana TaxID=110368 RepID=A0A6J1MIL0_BICAN|nr:uncharacterized protein LOC112043131 [Bicyclus anynana]